MTKRSSNLLKSVGAAALLLVASSLGAQSADLTRIEPAAHDWSGPYIGAVVGVGGYDTSGVFDQDDDADSVINLGALGDVGFLGGGTVGWNYQTGNTVFGIEGDISATSLERSAQEQDFSTGDQMVFGGDYLATVRGRVGVARNDVLLYATGGVAFLGGSLENRDSDESLSVDAVGPVVGAGIEWAVSQNVSVKIEGLYAFLDKRVDLDGQLDEGDTDDSFRLGDVVTARLGVNWNFGNSSGDEPTYEPDETDRNWTGGYVGAVLGAGAWVTSGYYDTSDKSSSIEDLGDLGSTGINGGGTVGWNVQNGNMVFGVEGDISFLDWSEESFEPDLDDSRIRFKGDLFATARGRVGYADGDLLVYGTAGVAFLNGTLDDGGTGETDDTIDVLATGLVLGAGMEWAAMDNVSVKVEGLYVRFNDSTDISDFGSGDEGDTFKLDDAVIARLGVNWAFSQN